MICKLEVIGTRWWNTAISHDVSKQTHDNDIPYLNDARDEVGNETLGAASSFWKNLIGPHLKVSLGKTKNTDFSAVIQPLTFLVNDSSL